MPVPGPFIWILLAFSIWMLSDAIRRRAGWFWYLIILVAPLGAVIYFVAVKLPSITASRAGSPLGIAVPNSAAPHRKLSSGFLTSSLERADQLEEAEQYDQAVPIYQEVLVHDANNLRALHGMARCELSLGHAQVAVALLEQVLNIDREFRNFGAALDYADALWFAGQKQDTIDLLDGLVKVTGRVNHRLAYAHYLAANGDIEKARTEANQVIEEHDALPKSEQQKQQLWLDRAAQMLSEWDRGN